MTERVVEDPPFAVNLRPDDRHIERPIPGVRAISDRKTRGRQHFYGGIDMHVILFGRYFKIPNPFGDRAFGWSNVDCVAGAVVARVRDPLPAGHELPFGRFAEGVAHPAV